MTSSESVRDHIARVLAGDALNQVAAFVAQRSEYVQAAQTSGDDGPDYYRWQGHMEARRMLAERLGWPVPFTPEDSRAVLEAVYGKAEQ